MEKPLFRQSFLSDTLDTGAEMAIGQLQLPSGIKIRLLKRGLLEVVPANISDQTKSIVVSAGVHGNETAPMELVDNVVSDILEGKCNIEARCLFMLAHPEATNKQIRFIEDNMNRLFDKRVESDSLEGKIAKVLMQDVADFFDGVSQEQRWHLDLHCAIRRSKHFTFAVSPKTTKPTRSKELIDFGAKAKLEAILLSNAPTSTFSWYTADAFGAQSLTVELGQVSPLGESDLSLISDFDIAFRGLLTNSLEGIEGVEPTPYRVTQTLKRTHEDFDFNFSDDIENFTRFEHGQVLGHDGDKILFAKVEQEAVVFPNKQVAIGHRAALMVSEVETRYENDQLVYD
ncbi:succinylglutamate desuccinylase [Vibrio hannami]|uniref:succinylglutamate desuccinylase n=1 Tax=Vibrio hannami TaxID=2717094 RepID=UPI00240EE89B|nr:succinylglutamate desuccinylase [Vibrio hannami]MDG3088024.1 succinylglutamate desuccinylase [Vibrio hannami]